MNVHCLSICVCGKDDQRYSVVCNVKNIYLLAYFGVSLDPYHYLLLSCSNEYFYPVAILVEQDVDVLLLTETKVYKNSAIHFDGYRSFSAVRNKKSGGGHYIGIKHGFCQSLMCCRGENAEFITVRMEGKYDGLRIVLVYGPQEKDTEENREEFYEDLSVEIDRCLLSGDSLLLAGDFNAKLGSEIM